MANLKISYNAPVILTFSLIAAAVHLITDWWWPEFTLQYFTVFPWLREPMDYLRLGSHVLGHGSWAHLFGNMTMILLLGPLLEERHGSSSLLIMIAITALVTGIINVAFLETALLGASGIVFMLILLASTANIKHGEIPLTFILVAVLFLGKEAVDAFRNDHISQMAHLVGGGAGAVFGFLSARSGDASPTALAVPAASPVTPKAKAKPLAD